MILVSVSMILFSLENSHRFRLPSPPALVALGREGSLMLCGGFFLFKWKSINMLQIRLYFTYCFLKVKISLNRIIKWISTSLVIEHIIKIPTYDYSWWTPDNYTEYYYYCYVTRILLFCNNDNIYIVVDYIMCTISVPPIPPYRYRYQV